MKGKLKRQNARRTQSKPVRSSLSTHSTSSHVIVSPVTTHGHQGGVNTSSRSYHTHRQRGLSSTPLNRDASVSTRQNVQFSLHGSHAFGFHATHGTDQRSFPHTPPPNPSLPSISPHTNRPLYSAASSPHPSHPSTTKLRVSRSFSTTPFSSSPSPPTTTPASDPSESSHEQPTNQPSPFIDFKQLWKQFELLDIDYMFTHSRNLDASQINEDIKWNTFLLSDNDRKFRHLSIPIAESRQSRPSLFIQEYREIDLVFSKPPRPTGVERILLEQSIYADTLASLKGSFDQAALDIARRYPSYTSVVEINPDLLFNFISMYSDRISIEKLRAYLSKALDYEVNTSCQLVFNIHSTCTGEHRGMYLFELILKHFPNVTERLLIFDSLLQHVDFEVVPPPSAAPGVAGASSTPTQTPTPTPPHSQSKTFSFHDQALYDPIFASPHHVQCVVMQIRKLLADPLFTESSKHAALFRKAVKPTPYPYDRLRYAISHGNYHEVEALALLGAVRLNNYEDKPNMHTVHMYRSLPTAHLVLKTFLRFTKLEKSHFEHYAMQLFDHAIPTLEYYTTVKSILAQQGVVLDVNKRAHDGSTPFLSLMAKTNIDHHLPLVKQVLDDNADVFSVNSSTGFGPLHSLARVEGSFNTMVLLAKHGCTLKKWLEMEASRGKSSPSPNTPRPPSPLHLMLQDYRPFQSQHLSDRMTLLLGHDTDVPSPSSIGTLYELASRNLQVSSDAFYNMCIRHIAEGHSMNDLGISTGLPVMYHSIATNNNHKLQILLDLRGDPNLRDRMGRTPLMYSLTQIVNRETLVTLLGANADPNLTDPQGKTALHYAVSTKDVDHVQFLLTMKADPNIKDARGLTPLCYYNGTSMPLLNQLRQCGADLDARDGYGNTYIMRMVTLTAIMNPSWFFEAVKRLGFKFNLRNYKGMSLYQVALPEYKSTLRQYLHLINAKREFNPTRKHTSHQQQQHNAQSDDSFIIPRVPSNGS